MAPQATDQPSPAPSSLPRHDDAALGPPPSHPATPRGFGGKSPINSNPSAHHHSARSRHPLAPPARAARSRRPLAPSARAARSRHPLAPPSRAACSRRPLAPPSRAACSRRPLAPSALAARSRRPLAPPSRAARYHRPLAPPSRVVRSLRPLTPSSRAYLGRWCEGGTNRALSSIGCSLRKKPPGGRPRRGRF